MADAGPLNGNTPPILISVAVTPGASAAHTGLAAAIVIIKAETSLSLPNIGSPPGWLFELGSASGGAYQNAIEFLDRSPAAYSSFLELVKWACEINSAAMCRGYNTVDATKSLAR